ncbi:helix-turn-helix domain-containing protein [Ruminiclostridium cellobioparum]|uniref:helix-turn-helix domain-containing protein n=1 Tax=Ruminiclostridium cellobioparum TaxID=29355 RepID=UPI0028A72A39|nr:helix-turn-helix transcriptional regulator [Ruminiclostridium cellobioparum]
MEYNLTVLGKRIREERTSRNLTIEQLAEIVTLSPSYLGLVERGERGLSVEKLIKVAGVFGISVDSLLLDTGTSTVSRFSEIEALLSNMKDEDVRFVVEFVKLLKERSK